jgi:small subunit ribosomal protein S16
MPARIRLQRFGKKANAYFHIVIADGRAPRDGKYIERIGSYNPNTNPATIDIDNEKALAWLNNGAQPSDTCRAILSYKGVLYKNHLLKGIAKGALTKEQAEEKFQKWQAEKANKVEAKTKNISASKTELKNTRLKAETEVRNAKAKAIAEKMAAKAAAPAEAVAPVEEQPAAPAEGSTEA